MEIVSDITSIALDWLKRIKEEVTNIIIGDHGENLGELDIYTEHGTADNAITNIPLIIKSSCLEEKHIDEELLL
ncbi:MAG: hypothetical protein L0I79_05040 [Atopostipes sp.]|nr:hypothetical protein [Atopostipes sp.]